MLCQQIFPIFRDTEKIQIVFGVLQVHQRSTRAGGHNPVISYVANRSKQQKSQRQTGTSSIKQNNIRSSKKRVYRYVCVDMRTSWFYPQLIIQVLVKYFMFPSRWGDLADKQSVADDRQPFQWLLGRLWFWYLEKSLGSGII